MTTAKINPLEHVLPAEIEQLSVTLAGKEFPIDEIGVDALGLFNRRHGEIAEAYLRGDATISREDEKAVQATLIALAVVSANPEIDFDAFANSVSNLRRLERELALMTVNRLTFSNAVIESAEGNAETQKTTGATAKRKPATKTKIRTKVAA